MVVTGASAGIGKQIALLSAELGAKVALVARRKELLGKIEEEITAKGGVAMAVPADITWYNPTTREYETFKAAINQVVERYGPIDYLVNNAGIFKDPKFTDMKTELIHDMVELNLTAALAGTKYALQHFSEDGVVLNMSSHVTLRHFADEEVYNATKAALNEFTLTLNESHGRMVAYALMPGAINTEIIRSKEKEWAPFVHEKTGMAWQDYLKKILQPEQVAAAAINIMATKPSTALIVQESVTF